MSDIPEIELSVGSSPFSKKPCLVLRRGTACRILARFDGEDEARAYLACNPYHDSDDAVKDRLAAIFDEE